MNPHQVIMKRIIIIGGGFAGLRLLYRLSKSLKGIATIDLVDKCEFSLEKPSLPEVAFTGKNVSKVRIPLSSVIKRKNARFIRGEVVRIDPEKAVIHLSNGESMEYDYLAIATGAVKDYDAIEGYREQGFSVCDDVEAERLFSKLKEFGGGHIVIGSAATEWDPESTNIRLDAPCEGPIGEIMFMVDSLLREKGLREKSSITVFSPGSRFFDDVGETVHREIEPMLKDHGISVVTNKILKRILNDHVEFSDGSSLESDFPIVIPPYRGPDLILNSNLGDKKGFVKTLPDMRHTSYRNIFVAGDVNADSMPKLGHIAIIQADIAAAAIKKDITGSGDIQKFSPEIFCIMNRGDSGATVILSDSLFGGNRDIAYSGKMASMFKWGFDGYYFYTHGHMPPDAMQKPVEWLVKMLH